MSQPNFYAVIPATVRYCEGLMPAAKLLYGEITALCTERGHCWASNSYFAGLYGVSEFTVSRWISLLEQHGFVRVKIDKVHGNQRFIYINDAIPLLRKSARGIAEKRKTLLTKSARPIDEKRKQSNTVSNEESITLKVRTDDEKNHDFENQKKEAPPIPARPPKELFAHSEWASNHGGFAAEIQSRFPAVPSDTDFQYYFSRCLDWSNSKPATSDDWVKIAAKFILDDQRRGELHTYQPSSHATRKSSGPSRPIIDTARISARARETARRLGYPSGE